jgi:glutaredoxin
MTSVRLDTTGSACPNCERARQILDRAGIRYVETNLRDNPDALSQVTDDLG